MRMPADRDLGERHGERGMIAERRSAERRETTAVLACERRGQARGRARIVRFGQAARHGGVERALERTAPHEHVERQLELAPELARVKGKCGERSAEQRLTGGFALQCGVELRHEASDDARSEHGSRLRPLGHCGSTIAPNPR
jgi:hypothetical protein